MTYGGKMQKNIWGHLCSCSFASILLPSSPFGEDTSKQFSAAAFLCCEHGLVAVPQYSPQEEVCLNVISIKFVYNDNQTLLVFVPSTQ